MKRPVGRAAPAARHFLGSKEGTASVALLVSGGVESAVLLAEALRRYERVYPLYIRKGFVWEPEELKHLKRLLTAFAREGLADLVILDVPVRALYRSHWSLGHKRGPGSRQPDAAVYLPGRNLLFLSLAGIFCGLRRIPVLWIGILKGNPFQDARPEFFYSMERLVRGSLGLPFRIVTPFRKMTKGQVIRRWSGLPWEKTFSCIQPRQGGPATGSSAGRHCGRCQKCGERKAGFRAAGVADPTGYMR